MLDEMGVDLLRVSGWATLSQLHFDPSGSYPCSATWCVIPSTDCQQTMLCVMSTLQHEVHCHTPRLPEETHAPSFYKPGFISCILVSVIFQSLTVSHVTVTVTCQSVDVHWCFRPHTKQACSVAQFTVKKQATAGAWK